MINTGENKITSYSELMTPKSIVIVTDVNSSNKDEIAKIFHNSTIYIDKKLDMPKSNNEIIGAKSNTISKIYDKLTSIHDDVLSNKSSLFFNESQFKNFKIKVVNWCYNQFKTVIDTIDNNKNCTISVNYYELSKHEMIFIQWLVEFGATLLIVSPETKIKESDKFNVRTIELDTNEHILLGVDSYDVSNVIIESRFNSTDDIESALYDNNETVKVVVSGITTYADTSNFYGKIYKKSAEKNGLVLITDGFNKPSYDSTSKIPRLPNTNKQYVLQTLLRFVSIPATDIHNSIKDAINTEFSSIKYRDIEERQYYNSLVYSICVLNELFVAHTNIKTLAYYGEPSNKDKIILSILGYVDKLSVIVMCSDTSKVPVFENIETLKLPNSTDIFPIPMVDRRDGAFTMAAQVQGVVDRTLFSGDTLGMYKPGQFRKCNIIPFNTTYDEIKLWWNKEMYLRPNFVANGDTVTIPTIFRVIKGVKEGTDYTKEIQDYCCGKTFLCKDIGQLRELVSANNCIINHYTDVKGTSFSEQKPFYKNGKLNREIIKRGKNFKYSLLDVHKQDLILDAIEDTINNEKVKKNFFSNDEAFVNYVLTVGLNFNIELLQAIQWFEFYNYNPNLILTLTDDDVTSAQDTVILSIIQNLGFDILIFVPTCYSTIENYAGSKLMYNTDIIGEAMYDIAVDGLKVTSNIEPISSEEKSKKQGIFSRLFHK